jgi:hypothetical protein
MPQKFLTEELRRISDKLKKINEAGMPPSPEGGDEQKPVGGAFDQTEDQPDPDANDSGNDTDVASDAHADASIDDMMTQEKKPEKLQGSVAIKNLAGLLGIDNTVLFTSAFNALRSGKIPSNQAQVRELAITFYKLLAADASTTSKVLSQLRRIHKSS